MPVVAAAAAASVAPDELLWMQGRHYKVQKDDKTGAMYIKVHRSKNKVMMGVFVKTL